MIGYKFIFTLSLALLFAVSTIKTLFSKKTGKKLIFFHIGCFNNYEDIIRAQIDKIHISGLYKEIDKIWCFIVGQDREKIEKCLKVISESGKKFQVADVGQGDKTFERFTLEKIKNYIVEGDRFLYIHSKGVGRTGDAGHHILAWRNYLEYFIIGRFKLCLRKLNKYDVVGVEFMTKNMPPHYRGNFWWCNANYFLTLPAKIGSEYTDPELYIGLNNPKAKNLWATYGCYFYHETYPYSKYVDHQDKPFYKRSKKIQKMLSFFNGMFKPTPIHPVSE